MPDVTTQPCYTGEPSTTNRGACHAGTQSCIGTLGACMGQQLPVAENCFNEIDDDCDGHLNDGCPASISLGDPVQLSTRGGTGGNENDVAMCPTGSIVTGLSAQLSSANNPAYLVSLTPTCAIPTLVRGTDAYSIMLTPTDSPPIFKSTDGARDGTSRIACSKDISMSAGVQGSNEGSKTVLESIGLDCSVVTLSLDNANHLLFNWTPDPDNSKLISVQITPPIWNDGCGPDSVLIGFHGRTGAQIDQVSGMCAPLVVNYK